VKGIGRPVRHSLNNAASDLASAGERFPAEDRSHGVVMLLP
jgi:hypothetical protein